MHHGIQNYWYNERKAVTQNPEKPERMWDQRWGQATTLGHNCMSTLKTFFCCRAADIEGGTLFILHANTQTQNRPNDTRKHWGFCPRFVFSISTICIPSLRLPQPIQTSAILNRATHTPACLQKAITVCPGPDFSQANNHAVRAETQQLHLSSCQKNISRIAGRVCNFISFSGMILRKCLVISQHNLQWEANLNNTLWSKLCVSSIFPSEALLHPSIPVPVRLACPTLQWH